MFVFTEARTSKLLHLNANLARNERKIKPRVEETRTKR
jgi:hypothetical protein